MTLRLCSGVPTYSVHITTCSSMRDFVQSGLAHNTECAGQVSTVTILVTWPNLGRRRGSQPGQPFVLPWLHLAFFLPNKSGQASCRPQTQEGLPDPAGSLSDSNKNGQLALGSGLGVKGQRVNHTVSGRKKPLTLHKAQRLTVSPQPPHGSVLLTMKK